ncbi:phage tail-like protein [Streptomyces sp. TLI_235]|nr:phage tail protein [Streptomyces sp. TLI_235]PBC75953.1 phage tail-like protein [Streptomyces sp. TLI_235]
MSGWLLNQLPQAMARDRVLAGFVRGCEETVDTVTAHIDDLEHKLDSTLAPAEMIAYLAGWLGIDVRPVVGYDADAEETLAAQRRTIRAVGAHLGRRGTAQGLEALLEALTGGRAEVTDSGGIFGPGDPVPAADPTVQIALHRTGSLTERQLRAVIAEELPIGVGYTLTVRGGGAR